MIFNNEVSLKKVIKTNQKNFSKKDCWQFVNYLDTGNITENSISEIKLIDLKKEKLPSRAKRKVSLNNIIYSTVRPNQKHFGFINRTKENFIVSTGFCVIEVDEKLADSKYVYYFLTRNSIIESLQSIAEQSVSTYPAIKATDIEKIKIKLPNLPTQKKIASILSSLDDKIELNNKINKNLEEMAQAIFKSWFVDFEPWGGEMPEDWESGTLGDYVECIDNRGKTPPLTKFITSYPIIDVKALKEDSRIINYDNCSKFVNLDTYNTWFRNGHPKEGDILLSTVGSIGEIKLFFGGKGCIAQNVVSLRSKKNLSLYLYESLKYLKKDLITYNIGSVQPSIKVTHILKYSLYIPSFEVLINFEKLSGSITANIYKNSKENKYLQNIRDTLLPKLMSGEIDVSNLDI